MNKIIFSFLLLFFPVWLVFAQTEEPRLEGVIYDGADPAASIAIINGESVQRGHSFHGYQVVEIESTAVVLKDEKTGIEKRLRLADKPPPLPKKTETPAAENPEAAASSKKDFKSVLADLWAAPGRLANRAWEILALRDVAIVNNACVLYYNMHKDFPSNYRQLVQANLLAASYESGVRKKYQIYFMRPPNPEDFGVHADPIDPQSGLRYFFVGTDAVIRESLGRPADKKSKPHDQSS